MADYLWQLILGRPFETSEGLIAMSLLFPLMLVLKRNRRFALIINLLFWTSLAALWGSSAAPAKSVVSAVLPYAGGIMLIASTLLFLLYVFWLLWPDLMPQWYVRSVGGKGQESSNN